MSNITLILFSLIFITLFSTFFYSILSRRAEGPQRGIYRAWMNLSMGVLFASVAIHLYTLELAVWGDILSTLILVIGLVNLYYGWKYKQYFSKQA